MLFIVLYVVIPVLCLVGIQKRHELKNIFDKNTTLAMRGVGMLFIVFTHMSKSNLCTETYFFYVSGVIGVAICFLVSGYGLHISYKRNFCYLERFWIPKILRLLLPFWTAYIYYWLSLLIRGESFEMVEVVKNLIAFTFPGVTLWYLKIQLLMYAIFYFSYRFFKKSWMKIAGVVIATVVYIIVAVAMGLASFWYNTCLFFGLGVLLAEYQDKILPFIRKNWVCVVNSCVFVLIYAILYFFGRMNMDWIIDTVYMLCFCSVLIWFFQRFMRFRILETLGKYSIEIYLFHIVISGEMFSALRPAAYILTPLVCVLIGIPVHWGTDQVIKFFKNKKIQEK
ncbi:acyltransferase [Dorea sp. YH-dor228]|uniref:acyltransferase family protein n=1 Tax=Dorea sp. YH-dor228 TaxID=3151120 RepID=UPI0032423095